MEKKKKEKKKKKENVVRTSDINRWILDPSPHKTDGTVLTRASITLRSRRAKKIVGNIVYDHINPISNFDTEVSLSQTLTRV